MLKTFCQAKIHRVTVTSVNLDYEGSITVDSDLLRAAGIQPYEQVHVLDIDNGSRFITYAIEGEPGSGTIQVNGAAAHLCKKGDLAIIISYCQLTKEESLNFRPRVVHVNSRNQQVQLIGG
ncbi:MAG: aspartate 1-decarboxylase [Candidatus Caenarcaniphilales bacterium]|nr:aspartate 1-decarboxylase [Candidatus Caenarcaniphilales bacterium]